MPSTGYMASVESNSVELSYGDEAVWGTLPAVAFKALRYTGESLSSSKTRQRATEIDTSRQAADMVTTQFSASGSINGAMSVGTYDDLFESLFCSTYSTDIMTNGNAFQSIYLQKKFSSSLWLRYPGAFVTGCNISAAVGGFATCSFNIAAKSETKSTTDASTGAVSAAPTNKIIDTVSMTSLINVGGSSAGKVESLSLDIANDGANPLFEIGSSAAAGMLPGVFQVNGRLRVYFENFTLYDRYVAETEGAFSFKFTDGTKSYLFEVLNGVVMNPSIVAGGPGQAVLCEVAIEGRKDSVTGKTMRITRDLT